MTDARRAAEEALARWDTYADRPHSDARHEALYACVRSLRALLAEREATPGPSCSTCDGYGSTTVPVHDRNGYPIPEQRKCDDCDGTGHVPLAPPPPPCGGRCEDALDSRSPCPSCAERLAPPPAPEAPILPVCLDCGFASGGHVHVVRDEGEEAVRYPTPEEWNAALRRSESARREAEENREMADGCLEEVREALVVMGMAEETTLKVAPMFYREAILHLFASERAARERAERENLELASLAATNRAKQLAAESSLSRAVEALRGAEAHHDEQARLWADNESDGEADLNAQYHSERRDVFKAVLVEVGK